jgi:small GTP-binding protein
MDENKEDKLNNIDKENNVQKISNEINKNINNKSEENENNMSSNESTKKDDSINSNTDLSTSCQFLKDEIAHYDISFKIIIIGDSFVGKSSLTIKAAKNLFENYYTATVGFEFFTMLFKINSKIIRLQIWDTCGQEEYRSLIQNFYRNASLAILVYSIDRRTSFENLEVWLNEVKAKGNPDVKIFLVGNKSDLEESREVSAEEGQKFYEEHKLNLFVETSAKTGLNVQDLFKKVAIILNQDHLAYKDMATKADKTLKLPTMEEENINNWEKDEEENVRKKWCCK